MKEIRVAEIRANDPAAAGDHPSWIISGRPVVYGVPTEIKTESGSYNEIVQRGALDGADLSDVRLLVGHDMSRIPLARTPKTMSLDIDDQGLSFRATLPDTEAGREAYQAVTRGDLKGMSYAFTVPKGGDEYDPATNTRTIKHISKVYECSLTGFPAYETTSVSAECRSAMFFSRGQMAKKRENQILINQILSETWRN